MIILLYKHRTAFNNGCKVIKVNKEKQETDGKNKRGKMRKRKLIKNDNYREKKMKQKRKYD